MGKVRHSWVSLKQSYHIKIPVFPEIICMLKGAIFFFSLLETIYIPVLPAPHLSYE